MNHGKYLVLKYGFCKLGYNLFMRINFSLMTPIPRLAAPTPTEEPKTKPKKPTVPAEPAKQPDEQPLPGGEPADSPCRF